MCESITDVLRFLPLNLNSIQPMASGMSFSLLAQFCSRLYKWLCVCPWLEHPHSHYTYGYQHLNDGALSGLGQSDLA